MHRSAVVILSLLLAALLTACSKPAPPSEEPAPAPPVEAPVAIPEPAPEPTPAPAPKTPSSTLLLPPAGQVLLYDISDEEKTVTEFFVQDGERLVGAMNGEPYVTWFTLAEGVWRQDLQGSTLLRYLPAELQAGAWTQQSGDADILTRLRQGPCELQHQPMTCWELTVLNRSVRSIFHFLPERGVIYAAGENLSNPAGSFEKSLTSGGEKGSPPDREAVLKGAPARPAGPLPAVTAISTEAFEQAERELLTKHGALLEIDLDQDGTLERIEGRLGLWHPGPIALYVNGARKELYGSVYPGRQQKLAIGTVTGIDQPALILQRGGPEQWHQIIPRWLGPKGIYGVCCWNPKIWEAWAGDARVEEGSLVITGLPAEMAGYQWTRRFQVKKVDDLNQPLRPELIEERITAGPYPDSPADLVTALFIARWWNLEDDLARYIPDAAVRAAFRAHEVVRVNYTPGKAALGKLDWTEHGYPSMAPAPLDANQSTEFWIHVGNYEGATHYAGRVTFGKAADGRLVITQIEITRSEFVY